MNNLNFDGLTGAQLRLFAVRCARRVQHLMADPRSIAALNVAERHAKGEATDDELVTAWAAAVAAAEAAEAAAADAAWDAAASAAAAAAATAWDAAASATAWAAAASAAAATAAAPPWAPAAWAVEREAQQKILNEIRKEQPR